MSDEGDGTVTIASCCEIGGSHYGISPTETDGYHSENRGYCNGCSETCSMDDLQYVDSVGGDRCESCRDNMPTCDGCDELHENFNLNRICGVALCDHCMSDRIWTCPCCQEHFDNEDETPDLELGYCEECTNTAEEEAAERED